MAAEFAISMAAPTPWKIRSTMSQIPAAWPGHPGHAEQQREEGEDGEAEVVDADPAVDVAQPAQRGDQDAGDHQEPEDHPQQVEAVAGLERVDADPAEDVGQGDQRDRAVDGRHQHAQRRDEQGDPLVAVVGHLRGAAGEVGRGRSQGLRGVVGHGWGPDLPFTWTISKSNVNVNKTTHGRLTSPARRLAPPQALPQVQRTLNRY